MDYKRGQWGSNFGFLMAAVGSAVGLGNIVGFPYKMGKNGGFAFLAIYLILTALVGIVIIDWRIRSSSTSPILFIIHSIVSNGKPKSP